MTGSGNVQIRPLKGYRPAEGFAGQTCELPYDVVDSEEARELAKGNERSLFRVSKAEIDFPVGTKYNDPKVYLKAKENLDEFIKRGYLVPDEKPCLYIYSLTFRGHTQNGIVCLVSVAQYNHDILMKHEEVREVRVADRSEIIRIQRANESPVFFTYRNNDEIDEFIREFKSTHQCICQFEKDISAVCNEKVNHQLWQIIDDEEIAELSQLVHMSVPRLYIADGHHRAASAARVGQKLAQPGDKLDESHYWFLGVMFASSELEIMDYNRLVKDLNGMSEDEFMNRIKDVCTVKVLGEKTPTVKPGKREFYMYISHKWYSLTPNHIPQSPVDFIDSAVLTDLILKPILGIADLKNDARIQFVGGIRGYKSLVDPVNEKKQAVAFALHSASIDELMQVSDKGLLMPPKSTWFEPKLISGMVVRVMDEERVPGGPALDANGEVLQLK